MPKVDHDSVLYDAIEAIVHSAGGNESEAARRLGTTRLRINRIRKSRGAATPAVRADLWKRLERPLQAGRASHANDTFDTEVIQIVRDVPGVALQVLRYMTGVIEREIGVEDQSRAR